MTLADELLGIKPYKTLQGTVVSHDDPVVCLTAEGFRHWINTVDDFTVEDVCIAFDASPTRARTLIHRERDASVIERCGSKKSGGRFHHVWRKKAEPMSVTEKANRKYFGA
jgi:hypothetical protein